MCEGGGAMSQRAARSPPRNGHRASVQHNQCEQQPAGTNLRHRRLIGVCALQQTLQEERVFPVSAREDDACCLPARRPNSYGPNSSASAPAVAVVAAKLRPPQQGPCRGVRE